jgi:hypothetical protein
MKLAKFQKADRNQRPAGDREGPSELEVHFNPASLHLTITNTLRGRGQQRSVSERTSKLAMELVFDTTGSGDDVRESTGKLAAWMGHTGTPQQLLRFDWGGHFVFYGTIESYSETIEYFSPEGVPLRATVSLTLSDTEPAAGRNSDQNRNGRNNGGGNGNDRGNGDTRTSPQAPAGSTSSGPTNGSGGGQDTRAASAEQQDRLRESASGRSQQAPPDRNAGGRSGAPAAPGGRVGDDATFDVGGRLISMGNGRAGRSEEG